MKRLIALFCLTAAPVWADGCPVAPDHSQALERLFDEVQQAQNDMEGRIIANRMWEYWTDAPDEPSQAMLDQGMRARGSYDFLTALDRFDKLVNYCPFYAEGYNQRAFINFLREDYTAALPDLEQALKLNPKHVGALAGKGLTLMALGRDVEAQEALRAAVALNPWLGERYLLKGKEL
ncbi:tetratricopeptide repeat protein [Aestuariicoccus sp. MJ-SS9]|uniref:tetratricopeptide repeat protein n=1 Tax=Aestuariicoccus sp. MJ-SS9 TaxID=3079855 RepID=UPI00290C9C7B|nr:tetratricopeptide repeat protein [Aestuariicoccus sp. MJ-SS9]MDU8913981.1 tetratricopeptide repeat protein [Aestuariicoccus sp. MJ-SS9]